MGKLKRAIVLNTCGVTKVVRTRKCAGAGSEEDQGKSSVPTG
jgi:hypothetical protein